MKKPMKKSPTEEFFGNLVVKVQPDAETVAVKASAPKRKPAATAPKAKKTN